MILYTGVRLAGRTMKMIRMPLVSTPTTSSGALTPKAMILRVRMASCAAWLKFMSAIRNDGCFKQPFMLHAAHFDAEFTLCPPSFSLRTHWLLLQDGFHFASRLRR